jgi:adenosylmethionine-8-amino-7-oxononanoate aminotransferase
VVLRQRSQQAVDAVTTHRLWHPFANMAEVDGNELVIDRGEDVWLYDEAGRRYLDGSGSLWYANAGHGREEIAAAVAEQLRKLDAYSTFGEFANRPALQLADRLAELAPVDDARVFLASGGGDAIDTAAKIARAHFQLRGEPGRTHLLSRAHAYHGTHGFGTSIAGIEANASGWGPLLAHTAVVEHDSLEALERELHRLGPETVAAFFCEPVIGAGGVRPPPEGYLEGAASMCAEHGVLFVADEVICGFGRLGAWFGVERWQGVRPDLITFAKGVTSGYLPVGGVIASGEVAAPFWEDEGAMFRHGPTYAGHPTCCAAALANLDVLEREGLVTRAKDLEGELAAVLAPLEDHDQVAEVRAGLGLIAGVELTADALVDPRAVAKVVRTARDHGVVVRALGSSVAVSPPLTVQSDHLTLIGESLASAFDALSRRVAGTL